jgi:hypothetical protein
MGTPQAEALAPAQPPTTAPAQFTAIPPAPKRGVRIARSRAELRPGAALDAAVLEAVMGWEWRQVEPPGGDADAASGGQPLCLLWNPKWGTPRGTDDVRPVEGVCTDVACAGHGSARALPWDAPRPSTDAAAAAEMEAEVERRGMQYPYVLALTAIVAHTKSAQQGWQNEWHLLRATPAQRCHAALRAAGYGPRC